MTPGPLYIPVPKPTEPLAGESEEFLCFVTPEAYTSLKEWMDFRSSYGEKITGESWVMPDIWQTTNINYGARLGLATCPRKLKSSGIKRLLERAIHYFLGSSTIFSRTSLIPALLEYFNNCIEHFTFNR